MTTSLVNPHTHIHIKIKSLKTQLDSAPQHLKLIK